MSLRRVAYGSVGRISRRSSQSILEPCRVVVDGPCSCPACSQSMTAIGKSRNLCTSTYTTKGPQLAEESCTGSRSCSCRKCRAGAPHDVQPQPIAGILSARGITSQGFARRLSSPQGASSSNVQATHAYSSMAVSRLRKEQSFQSRTLSTLEDCQSQLDAINDAFVEARDEIEYAQEDSETVYFEEGLKTAQKAVADALEKYNRLLSSLTEEERGKLQRSMGLKMEQLKAELHNVEQTHA